MFLILPCIDTVARVDTRIKTFDVPPQKVCSTLHAYCSTIHGRIKGTAGSINAIFSSTGLYIFSSTHTPYIIFPQILSKDSVTVHVDAIVNFRIVDPVLSINNVVDVDRATKLLAQTTLRNILGSHKLSELLESRNTLQQQLRVREGRWGGGLCVSLSVSLLLLWRALTLWGQLRYEQNFNAFCSVQ